MRQAYDYWQDQPGNYPTHHLHSWQTPATHTVHKATSYQSSCASQIVHRSLKQSDLPLTHMSDHMSVSLSTSLDCHRFQAPDQQFKRCADAHTHAQSNSSLEPLAKHQCPHQPAIDSSGYLRCKVHVKGKPQTRSGQGATSHVLSQLVYLYYSALPSNTNTPNCLACATAHSPFSSQLSPGITASRPQDRTKPSHQAISPSEQMLTSPHSTQPDHRPSSVPTHQPLSQCEPSA